MANSLTNLIPQILLSLDTVSREQVGFIPNVFRNSSAEQAALNQTINYPITPSAAMIDIVPGVTAPDMGDQTIGNGSMTISRSKGVPVRWNGEQQKGALNAGWYAQVLDQQFQQAFRTLVNGMEADLAGKFLSGSAAWGTIGTVPFGTAGDLTDLAQCRKILTDRGTPTSSLKCVLGSSAAAALRGKQSLLLKVNESGSDAVLRRGALNQLPIEGFDIGESGQIATMAGGTGNGYVTSGATAKGVTSIALVTGTGTILPGDIVSFAGDIGGNNVVNQYVVLTGTNGPGTITINNPGIMAAAGIASGVAMTVVSKNAIYTANMVYDQMAMHLVTRAPAMPIGPDGKPMDSADDVIQVTDPFTGLVFQVAVYPMFQQIMYLISIAWGTANVKPEHTGLLIH